MADLHIHTNLSDSTRSVEEVVDTAISKDLTDIAITDHNDARSADAVREIAKKRDIPLNVYTGSEFGTSFEKRQIEIVGIGFDDKIVAKYLKDYHQRQKLINTQQILYNRLLEIVRKERLNYDPNSNYNNGIQRLYNELAKYKENTDAFPVLQNYATFIRQGLYNPESMFFLGYHEFTPDLDEILQLIEYTGGKSFIPHPHEFGFNDTFGYLTKLQSKHSVDGLEAFNPQHDNDETKALIDFASKNNKLISGGSDDHGDGKKHQKIGMINIDKQYLEWLNPDVLTTSNRKR